MSDREKFEAWFVDHNMKTRPPQDYWFALDEDGKYIERDVFEAYRVWKACAESMQAEIDKRDARIAQLEEALKGWSGIINHQYTASWDAMNFLQTADNIGQEALSTSSDTWLAEHDKERDAEIAELKNRLAISQVLNIRMCGEGWFVDHNLIAGLPQDCWFALDEDGKYIECDVFEAYRVWKACAESMQAEIDKRDARLAQLEWALNEILGSPSYLSDDIANAALSTSASTWLADKIKDRDAEIAELKNRLAISQVLNIRMCGEGAPEELWEEVAQEELTSLLAKERERCAEVMDKFNAVYYAAEIRSLK